MQRATRLMLQLIMFFSDEENVIYFLIKHREDLKHIYRSNFFNKIFSKMYLGGISEARDFVIKSYERRGFHNITQQIANTMEEIEVSS